MQPSRKVAPDEVIFGPAVVLAGATQEPRSGQSVYVVADTINAIGPADELRRQHPNARVVDVAGTTILPGLTDAHGHLYGLGLSLDIVNVVGANSYEEVIERVKERVSRAGKWDGPIVTEIVPAGEFWTAEDYHQKYLEKHPGGYSCHYLRD